MLCASIRVVTGAAASATNSAGNAKQAGFLDGLAPGQLNHIMLPGDKLATVIKPLL